MPDVWVSRWYGVIAGESTVPVKPRYSTTPVSNANAPDSICCNVATAVNSLVIDAVSKRM